MGTLMKERIESRGRYKVLSKEEVFEALSDKEWHRKLEIAGSYGVSASTVSARVRELAEDGWAILTGVDGYRLQEPEDISDEDAARAVEKMTRWMMGVVTRQAISAKPMKRLLGKARKILPKSRDERTIVRKYLVQLTHLIDWDESEEDDL
jgi:biotin operon repressor